MGQDVADPPSPGRVFGTAKAGVCGQIVKAKETLLIFTSSPEIHCWSLG